jgi:hypothetical protein
MTKIGSVIKEATVAVKAIRRLLAIIFLFSLLATGTELLLVEHTEDAWQWAPLILIASGLLIFLSFIIRQTAPGLRIFQFLMVLFVLSGIIGMFLHYEAKMEFKLEINPDLSGWNLFLKTIQGASLPPILAPGMMIQLGLIGWAYTYNHPIFMKRNNGRELSA